MDPSLPRLARRPGRLPRRRPGPSGMLRGAAPPRHLPGMRGRISGLGPGRELARPAQPARPALRQHAVTPWKTCRGYPWRQAPPGRPVSDRPPLHPAMAAVYHKGQDRLRHLPTGVRSSAQQFNPAMPSRTHGALITAPVAPARPILTTSPNGQPTRPAYRRITFRSASGTGCPGTHTSASRRLGARLPLRLPITPRDPQSTGDQ